MASSPQTTTASGDVIDLLIEQHHQVRELLGQVTSVSPVQRQPVFDELRELLARHETGEEMVLRPLTRSLAGGDAIAQGRFDEENDSKVALAGLEKLDVTSDEFLERFAPFRAAVLAHAEAEERDEFPALRAGTDPEVLASARGKLQTAEAIAPTHPHPSAATTLLNYALGPVAAVLDRVRDLIGAIR